MLKRFRWLHLLLHVSMFNTSLHVMYMSVIKHFYSLGRMSLAAKNVITLSYSIGWVIHMAVTSSALFFHNCTDVTSVRWNV